MLLLDDLHVKYAGATTDALQRISMSVASGEILALVGPSGSGKSTLLRAIAGLVTPHRGSIQLADRTLHSACVQVPPQRRRIGMVFQDYALFPHMTVARNVRFGIHRRDDAAQRVREMLALVGLEGYADRYPHELSGGEQQRVALARALAPQPEVLLLDEPFSNLDEYLKAQVRREVLGILQAAGTTAILVTHDTRDAMAVADRVALLRSGWLVQHDTPGRMYRQPKDEAAAKFFGEVNVLEAIYLGEDRLLTELGTVAHQEAWRTAQLLVRPHELSLSVVPSQDSVPMQVVGMDYLGATTRYELIHNESRYVATHTQGVAIRVGATVHASIDVATLGILPKYEYGAQLIDLCGALTAQLTPAQRSEVAALASWEVALAVGLSKADARELWEGLNAYLRSQGALSDVDQYTYLTTSAQYALREALDTLAQAPDIATIGADCMQQIVAAQLENTEAVTDPYQLAEVRMAQGALMQLCMTLALQNDT